MDPFGWISGHCHVSSSQEEMLNTAPYLLPNLAPPSPESEDDETVVVMMSVPETSAEDEFRTPPERHPHSLTSSKEEARVHEEVDCGGREDMEEEKTVDLTRDLEVFGCDGDVKKVEEEAAGTVGEGEKRIGEDNVMDDKDLAMEDGRVPFSDCCEASRDVEPIVEGNRGFSANPEMTRAFCAAETDYHRDVGAAKVDELRLSSKDIAEEVERVTCTATLDDSSLNVRKLPSSFCAGSQGDGATGDGRGVWTEKRDAGVETSQAVGHTSVGANKQGTGDADDGSGKKPSEASEKEEPNEDEQTENILKVLGLLAKPLRPVYTEKVDVIGSAIKAGITFPRPSWWPEDSDDDSI